MSHIYEDEYHNLNFKSTNKNISKKISQIEFGLMSPEVIRRMSFTEISNPDTYDEDGFPIENGLMDPRLGVIDPSLKCRSCGSKGGDCQGHFGSINLTRPVIHVGFADTLHKILRSTCHSCGRILLTDSELADYKDKIEYLMNNEDSLTNIIKEIYTVARRDKCPHCGEKQKYIKIDKPFSLVEGWHKLTPIEVRERLEIISDEDALLLGVNPEVARPEWMVLTVIPVPPVTVRPSITLKTGGRLEDDLTHKLVDILRINQRFKDNIEAGEPEPILNDKWELLQYHIATYFDNEVFGIPPARHRSGRPLKTLAQRLKGKEGRFRSNLSGKGINFSARSVISPDPNISINEVGVPEIIATKITVPAFVTEWNIEEMKQYVLNGPNKHPGAKYAIRPDKRNFRIIDKTKKAVANRIEPGWIIERHLKDGDIVLMSRQPSHQRMSILAHEVKVMPEKTFFLNPLVCTPYQATFDGEEMNMHAIQSVEAQGEASSILKVQENLISPMFGGPITGAIHDHLIGAYLLTKKGVAFTEEDVLQILKKAKLPLPDKTGEMWTGKQIFSQVLPEGLNMVYRAEICRECDDCIRRECKNDAYVVIEDGELITGVIDKKAYGTYDGKILHEIFIKCADCAREFLESSTKMALSIIMKSGFTLSSHDIEIPTEAKERIDVNLDNAQSKVDKLIEDYHNNLMEPLPCWSLEDTLENKIMQVLDKERDKSGKIVENYLDIDQNHALSMVLTGTGVSKMEMTQITACVGQQMVRGGRINRGYNERTLPHFRKGELSVNSRGFVQSSYKKGLDPTEFFFHAIGGREELVKKHFNLSMGGYMQRRLIYALTDFHTDEGGKVMNMQNKVIQLLYGEDGVNPVKSYHGKVIDLDKIIAEIRMKTSK